MQKLRYRIGTIAAVVTAALSVAGTASAALPDAHPAGSDGHEFAYTGSAASEVTINYKPRKDKFVGKVSSDFVDTEGVLETEADEMSVCVTGRKVTVYKARRRRSDVEIGSDRVNAEGRWSVAKRKVDGRYYAKVATSETLLREYYGGIDYYVTCAAAVSAKIRL